MRAKKKPTPADNRRRVEELTTIASKFEHWRPAASVLTVVRGVQTRFLWVDEKTGIGAWPLERVCVVHGESGEGKTVFVIGLGGSFLDAGGWFLHIDAERTTPVTWLKHLLGPTQVQNERFLALRPDTFEEAVAAVREFAQFRMQSPEHRVMPALIAVDSIRKLVPKNLLDELMKSDLADEQPAKRSRFGSKNKGVDGASGRAAQIKARLNSAWLDELIPLADKANLSVVLIARELDGSDDDPYGKYVIVGGGKALNYDASLRCRVSRAEAIFRGEGKDAKLIGERHRVEIRKTKIAGKEELWPRAYFHTSTGVLDGVPAGFDPARDAVQLGVELKAIKLSGSYYSFGPRKLGQGEDNAVRALVNDPSLLAEVQRDLRALFELEGETLEERAARQPGAAEASPGTRVPGRRVRRVAT